MILINWDGLPISLQAHISVVKQKLTYSISMGTFLQHHRNLNVARYKEAMELQTSLKYFL